VVEYGLELEPQTKKRTPRPEKEQRET